MAFVVFLFVKGMNKLRKQEAEKCSRRFDFYDSELTDSWGLNHAVFFSPEERFFYADESDDEEQEQIEEQK